MPWTIQALHLYFETDQICIGYLVCCVISSLVGDYSHILTLIDVSGSSEDLQMECPESLASNKLNAHSSPLKSGRNADGTAKRRARTSSATYTSAGDGLVVRAGTRTIYTAGRPPWYDSHGELKQPFVIGRITYRFLFKYTSATK